MQFYQKIARCFALSGSKYYQKLYCQGIKFAFLSPPRKSPILYPNIWAGLTVVFFGECPPPGHLVQISSVFSLELGKKLEYSRLNNIFLVLLKVRMTSKIKKCLECSKFVTSFCWLANE